GHRPATAHRDIADVTADVSADVVVIGDGPAGSALAASLRRLGVDVALVGPGEPWAATYTTWADDIEDLVLLDGAQLWAHRFDQITVRFDGTRVIDRPYGVVDNDSLRAHLQRDVRHVVGVIAPPGDVAARVVIDATGWPSKLLDSNGSNPEAAGWQTAFGVVLAAPPSGPLGQPMMMDFSDPGAAIAGRDAVPTFAYSLPVAGGWLVEETVLTASPSVDPAALRPVLASRLGLTVDELLTAAVATETVRIPMGAPPPPANATGDVSGPVRFGAAAGMIHPATGYSIGSALRSADRVAAAIGAALDGDPDGAAVDLGPIRDAVWDPAARRTRQLHDYGHDVLLRLDRVGVQQFFDTFFELPVETWSPYMRVDTPPARLAGVMAKMFAAAPWRLRARLVTGDPRRFVRLLRP
ncbi:MAG: lycopene cyclase family protein, partial [Ilumatobacter sp.]|uniref:lycopene cyclase family protein n=1 Tax=Ilumatobacter sp. TaxID=1967498 RepID=UPI003C71B1DA